MFTRIPRFLVSDVILGGNDSWMSNTGTTLPNSSNATHNGGFTPLFFTRTGGHRWTGVNYQHAVIERGQNSFLWSGTVFDSQVSNWMAMSLFTFWPSQRNARVYPFPLRCLVSTTNS